MAARGYIALPQLRFSPAGQRSRVNKNQRKEGEAGNEASLYKALTYLCYSLETSDVEVRQYSLAYWLFHAIRP